jgi:hypothetical protein
MLELVKGHSLANTVDTEVFIFMAQACWRLSIGGEGILS